IYVRMPWFHIDRKTALTFSAALIYIACGIVKNLQHGYNTIGSPIGTGNIRTCGPYIVYGKTYSPGGLGNFCSLFQGIINTVNTIVLHCQKETGGHLGLWGPGIE